MVKSLHWQTAVENDCRYVSLSLPRAGKVLWLAIFKRTCSIDTKSLAGFAGIKVYFLLLSRTIKTKIIENLARTSGSPLLARPAVFFSFSLSQVRAERESSPVFSLPNLKGEILDLLESYLIISVFPVRYPKSSTIEKKRKFLFSYQIIVQSYKYDIRLFFGIGGRCGIGGIIILIQ